MKKTFLRVVFALPMMLLLFSPISGAAGEEQKNVQKPVIGVILPFSSAFEDIAEEEKNAIEMAIGETQSNAEIIFKDGKDDPDGAIRAFTDLAGRKQPPVAVISCASWASDAIHPLAAEAGIFHIAIGSAIIERTRPGRTVRFTLDAKQEERQLAEYLSRFHRIAVYNMDNGYGNNWAEIIQDNFQDKIVAALAYDPQMDDFGPDLAKIKKQNPDVVVLLSAGNAARIAQQARQMGIEAQLVGTRPIERPSLLDEPAANGMIYTYPSHSFNHPLLKKYENAHATPPTFFGLEAYDAVTSLISALGAGNDTPDALFKWYAGRTYKGALGEIQFDENGDAGYPYMYKQVCNGNFEVADFQFALLLEKTRQQIMEIFHDMDQTLESAAGKLAETGLKGPEAQAVLHSLYKSNPHAFNCTTIDTHGRIVNVAPEKYGNVLGADISGQNQVKRLHETQKPVVSHAIDAVEGFVGFDFEHPVFNKEGQFIGSVSILTRPGFFGSVISQKVSNFPVEMVVMQKDGRLIYDINEEEIGKNLFAAQMYSDYPSLLRVGRKMAQSPRGSGGYLFLDKKMETNVEKQMLWDTVGLHGTEFRLALARVINDFR